MLSEDPIRQVLGQVDVPEERIVGSQIPHRVPVDDGAVFRQDRVLEVCGVGGKVHAVGRQELGVVEEFLLEMELSDVSEVGVVG